jgi:glycosyltransferase involved in cell wall biosynthesis
MNKSISFIIPFYNEKENLKKTLNNITKLIKFYSIKDYEIILINDFSSDSSEIIALNFKKKNRKIFYIRHKKNMGLGAALKTGFNTATKNFISWIPGDNEHTFEGLRPLFDEINSNDYDIIIPSVVNKNCRPITRQIISYCYTVFLNCLFFKKIEYYNGCTVYKRKIIKHLIDEIKNPSMTFVSELLLRSLKLTKKIKMVRYKLNANRRESKSSALKMKNIIIGIIFILKLRLEI